MTDDPRTATSSAPAQAARIEALRRGHSVAPTPFDIKGIAPRQVVGEPGSLQRLVGQYGDLLTLARFCQLAGGTSLSWYYKKLKLKEVPPPIYRNRCAFIPEAWATAWVAAQVEAQYPKGWAPGCDTAKAAA